MWPWRRGFYDLPDGAGGKSEVVEVMLAEVEAAASAALAAVDRTGSPPRDGSDGRAALALYIAFQMTRTTEHRERILFPRRVIDWAQARNVTRALVAEYLETQHLGFAPRDPEVDGAFTYVTMAMQDPHFATPEFAVEMMLATVSEMVPRLLGLNWAVEVDVRREFVSSDTPVVVWRKSTIRDQFEGLGIDKADEVRSPLDPEKQLSCRVDSARPRIEVAATVSGSSSTSLGVTGSVFADPDNRRQLDAQRLEERRPVIRFNVGPVVHGGA